MVILIAPACLLCFLHLINGDDISAAREIIPKDYDKAISPLLYAKGSHPSAIYLNILRVRDLDAAKGELILEAGVYFAWRDQRLVNTVNNMNEVYRISPNDVWVPPVNIINRLEPDENTVTPLVGLTQHALWWAPRYVLRTACAPNLKYYPFDIQKCSIEIASVTQDGDSMGLNESSLVVRNNAAVMMKYHIENIQWKIVSAQNSQDKRTLRTGIEISVEIFTLTLQRRFPLVALGILAPSMISVVLLLVTFWMKSENVVSTGINVTSLLIASSSLFSGGRILPNTGTVTPIIVEYAATALVMTMLSCMQAVASSVLGGCQRAAPLSTSRIVARFPKWTLVLLQIEAQTTTATEGFDRTFLFSDLAEGDKDPEAGNANVAESKRQTVIDSWPELLVLLNRISFYVYAIVIALFVLSVMINE